MLNPLATNFDKIFADRIKEADAFYAQFLPKKKEEDFLEVLIISTSKVIKISNQNVKYI